MANPTREALAAAAAHAARVADALTEALDGSDRDTHEPGALVDIIDGPLRQLYEIRERAVG